MIYRVSHKYNNYFNGQKILQKKLVFLYKKKQFNHQNVRIKGVSTHQNMGIVKNIKQTTFSTEAYSITL